MLIALKKRGTKAIRSIFVLITLALTCSSPGKPRATPETMSSQKRQPAQPITILDQQGRIVPNAAPKGNVNGNIVDVTVGPGGSRTFSPSTVTIVAGDSVRWTWASSNHSVTGGNPCTPSSQFCSPNDMNCANGTLSNTGTVYLHTFNQAGTFSYFCFLHCLSGMTGVVKVVECTPPPPGMISWWQGEGNGHDIQNGNEIGRASCRERV